MSICAYVSRPLGSIKDVAATITFKSAVQITAVTCNLTLRGVAAGGITGASGGFVNSLGTTAADKVWTVSYADFNPTVLALTIDDYVMKFFATRSDGDVETPEVGIKVED